MVPPRGNLDLVPPILRAAGRGHQRRVIGLGGEREQPLVLGHLRGPVLGHAGTLPVEERGKRPVSLVRPGTDLDAGAAGVDLVEVRHAAVEIEMPLPHPADHLLFLVDGVRRTDLAAHRAVRAHRLDAEIDRRVEGERQIRQHRREAHVGAVLPRDQRGVPPHRPEARRDREGDVHDLGGGAAEVGIRLRVPAPRPDPLRQVVGRPPDVEVAVDDDFAGPVGRQVQHLGAVHRRGQDDGVGRHVRDAVVDRFLNDAAAADLGRAARAGVALDLLGRRFRVVDPALLPRRRAKRTAVVPSHRLHLPHDLRVVDEVKCAGHRAVGAVVGRVVELAQALRLRVAHAGERQAGQGRLAVAQDVRRRRQAPLLEDAGLERMLLVRGRRRRGRAVATHLFRGELASAGQVVDIDRTTRLLTSLVPGAEGRKRPRDGHRGDEGGDPVEGRP